MSASQIPNLLQHKRHIRTKKQSGSAGEAVLRSTDDDAAGSRQSAVNVGYLADDFADLFSPSGHFVRRMPVINRGTYVRTTAIDHHVQSFIREYSNLPVQIISIGAGSDTRPFRLLQHEAFTKNRPHYIEIDFSASTSKKIVTIKETSVLLDLLDDAVINVDQTCLTSSRLSIHAMDLGNIRSFIQDDISPSGDNDQKFGLSQIVNPSKPTLLLAECCLTYLSLEVSNMVLSTVLSNLLSPSTAVRFVQYDPIHPHDAFGKTMISNLSARHLSLPGLEALPMITDHQERLTNVGFDGADGIQVRAWWDEHVSTEEKRRLQVLEGLDEEEEWVLLASHYAIIRAWRNIPTPPPGPLS